MAEVGFISTFLPTQCGIATYVNDLNQGLTHNYPELTIKKFELSYKYCDKNHEAIQIKNTQVDDYYVISDIINASNIDVIDIQHEFKIFGKPDGENIEILLDNIKKPIVSTLHTVNFQISGNRRRIFSKILRRSNFLFVFSAEAKRHIVNEYGLSEKKLSIIPHGVPEISANVKKIIFEDNSESSCTVFMSAGHMRETKGYDVAIKALNSLKQRMLNFHYIIIGSNHPENETAQTFRTELFKLIDKLGLRNNITFINEYLSQRRLIELIQSADICILPYTRKEQSSSGILSLMIACGRPIITTPFQFANSIFNEKSGLIAESFSPDDFAKAIDLLIERKNEWSDIMNYNYELGKSWRWSVVTNQYFKVYQEFLKS